MDFVVCRLPGLGRTPCHALSSRDVTWAYPPEEHTTTSHVRYMTRGKLCRKSGLEILLCTDRWKKID